MVCSHGKRLEGYSCADESCGSELCYREKEKHKNNSVEQTILEEIPSQKKVVSYEYFPFCIGGSALKLSFHLLHFVICPEQAGTLIWGHQSIFNKLNQQVYKHIYQRVYVDYKSGLDVHGFQMLLFNSGSTLFLFVPPRTSDSHQYVNDIF